jgi:VWFA-related protein
LRTRIGLLAVLLAITAQSAAARSVTVSQLERTLASAHGKSDKRTAELLSSLTPTERIGTTTFARWQPLLPGPESRRELVILADQSAFLPPPPAEIPSLAPPNLEKQRQILALAVDYAARSVHLLPNFLATRETIHFEDNPVRVRDLTRDPAGSFVPYEPLHAVNRTTAHVLYHDGNEVVEATQSQNTNTQIKTHGLITWGEFGPILTTVLVDAANGTLAWRRWERSADGLVAVFHFAVPQEKSHYRVNLLSDSKALQEYSGYHGEIAVDPADGTIRSLLVQADLKPSDSIVRADLLVQYGPVAIGGKEYICPRKSVALSVVPLFSPGAASEQRRGPLQTMLNDVAFEGYRVFRSEMRVLTGSETGKEGNNPPSQPTSVASASEHADAALQSPIPAANSAEPLTPGEAASAPAPETSAVQQALATQPAPAPPVAESAPAPQPAPEIAVAGVAPVPDSSSNQLADKGFSLRVTTRLVDIGIVAVDKHGHPVTDLKADDFEIYDNGRKQVVRSFTPAANMPAQEVPGVTHSSDASEEQPMSFSNSRAPQVQDQTKDQDAPPEDANVGHQTIILIDTSNLAWADLTFARERLLNFLQHVVPGERIGVYLLSGRQFQTLIESSTDHAAVIAGIRTWMPSAQQLARAQDEEARNRQQFDEVLHRDDLSQVNGTMNAPGQTQFLQDPQLRDYSANPAREAMMALIGIARHVATMPGRTSLVWVASDNVLVNWSDVTTGAAKPDASNDNWVTRTEEALSDARISLYPLDASQLSATSADASLQNSSVELSPSVPRAPGATDHQGGFAGAGLGRDAATMQQNVHAIQATIVNLAEATGGRVFRRGGDLSSNLESLVREGDAAYQVSFAPTAPPDDSYHMLTVKIASRRNVVLRYRKGYLYSKEPALMADRFRQAVWQPLDSHEIALTAHRVSSFNGGALKLSVAIDDLGLKLQEDRWVDSVDIFVVRRSADEMHARINGRTLAIALRPETYQAMQGREIPFDQLIEKDSNTASFRILAVDENSGRMGSLTIPASALDQDN